MSALLPWVLVAVVAFAGAALAAVADRLAAAVVQVGVAVLVAAALAAVLRAAVLACSAGRHHAGSDGGWSLDPLDPPGR